jgi:diketogulonate reductase-like aldo/keto reductase
MLGVMVFVIAGGAGVVILEELGRAKARGATIYAEIVGYGANSDGYDMVQPSGEGAVRCMRLAMDGLACSVDYINPHGTSTPIGDLREIEAVREVFGEKIPPISSTKSLTGHSLGATGAQEAIYSILMMQNNFICESANIEKLEPDFVPEDKQAIIDNKLEILNVLQELVVAGKVRHIGLSDDSAWGIKQFVDLAEQHGLPRIVSIQNEYNLLRRRDEHDIAETCSLENVAYMPWSPLAGGVLSGKYLEGQIPAGSRLSREVVGEQWDRFGFRLELHSEDAVRAYIGVADKHGLDVCQMAIAFTLGKPWVTSTIIGATSMQQLTTDIAAIGVQLTPECLQDIRTIYQDYPVPF